MYILFALLADIWCGFLIFFFSSLTATCYGCHKAMALTKASFPSVQMHDFEKFFQLLIYWNHYKYL